MHIKLSGETSHIQNCQGSFYTYSCHHHFTVEVIITNCKRSPRQIPRCIQFNLHLKNRKIAVQVIRKLILVLDIRPFCWLLFLLKVFVFIPQYFKRSNIRNETSTLECAFWLVSKSFFRVNAYIILMVNVSSLDDSIYT